MRSGAWMKTWTHPVQIPRWSESGAGKEDRSPRKKKLTSYTRFECFSLFQNIKSVAQYDENESFRWKQQPQLPYVTK